MKKLYIVMAMVVMASMPTMAQDTYEGAKLMGSDLNGTARYVGMGGAMEALGADISTIGTNPAGIGLFRHSTLSASMSVVSQQDAVKFDNMGKTNASFDQVGFVYTTRTGARSFVNLGFNYHKSRNFDQILSAANSLNGASLNKVGFSKFDKGNVQNGGYDLDFNSQGDLMGYETSAENALRAYTFSQVDYLYMNAFNLDYDEDGSPVIGVNDGEDYQFNRAHSGWISDFDFNLSGNVNDRVYLGVTFGLHDVNYEGYSEYAETIAYRNPGTSGETLLSDERKIEGTGFDVKAGIIFRPIEYSPFRVGLSIATPTWYNLKSSNFTRINYDWQERDAGNIYSNNSQGKNGETYEFKMFTPWKFGLSLGHTIGTQLALGAGYEYADYSATDMRVNDGYDYYGDPESYSDKVMNDQTEHTLKGVSTIKLGAELKPDPAMAVRVGYNYVSPMYEKNGMRDATINSIGVMYSSTTDYVNWEATHRITCGFGYKYDGWNFDLAYQYSTTNGTFHPFQPNTSYVFDNSLVTNTPPTVDVSNKRHQVLFTVGYTF
ncbi:MAG: hemin receptor [Prevotella sp.]|nr:hemin receptor [Prevotella sp.]